MLTRDRQTAKALGLDTIGFALAIVMLLARPYALFSRNADRA
ncbi:MAG: hypothetical protein QOJ58_2845 [Alphaproteobacteria bacterium]|jgi:hypothetical protein|nr:hypothetical protein [Alphaproteobacteria bacterium]